MADAKGYLGPAPRYPTRGDRPELRFGVKITQPFQFFKSQSWFKRTVSLTFNLLPMTPIAIALPDEVFSARKQPPREFVKDLRLAAAIHWYARGEISMEKGAMIAGLDRVDARSWPTTSEKQFLK